MPKESVTNVGNARLRRLFSVVVSRNSVVLAACALFLFSWGIYAGALNHGFVWDDMGVLVEDQQIRDLSNLPSFFVSPLVLGDAEAIDAVGSRIRYYRPLISTLHALEYRLFGVNPFGYKIINLLLNGGVVVCAFLLVRALTGGTLLAFLAVLLYAANPARGEVVYWVYSDAHLFGSLFLLLAFLAYHYGRTVLALLGVFAGLLCLESVVLFPLVLVIYHLTIASKQAWRWQRLVPFVALAAFYLVFRQQIAGAVPIADLALMERLWTIAFLSVKYLQIFFVTDAPVTMYLYLPGMFSTQGMVSTGVSLLAIPLFALGGCLWWFRRAWFFWFAWFFVFILPSFNAGSYTDYLLAEKGLYLAALGPCVLVVAAVLNLKRLQWAGLVLLLALIGYQAAATVERGRYWSDTVTYLEKLLQFEPAYHVAQYQLGTEYLRLGRYAEALHQFDVFLRLRPGWQQRITELQVSINTQWGRSLAERGDLDGALAALHRARQLSPGESTIYNNLGTVHYLRGERSQAIENWQVALRLDPGNSEARSNLALFPDADPK